MKKNGWIIGGLSVFLVLSALTYTLSRAARADEYTATTMRLLRYEGTVEIEGADGASRPVMENVRFESGESMRTGAASTASVGLDTGRVVTLDEKSRVEFTKQNKALERTLTEGSLLLDVQDKLSDDETMDVKTSTMAVGIRGTVIYLHTENERNSDEDNLRRVDKNGELEIYGGGTDTDIAGPSRTELFVLEGKTELTYTDMGATPQTISVSAGQKATLVDEDGDKKAESAPAVEPLSEADMTRFFIGISFPRYLQ